MEHKITHFLYCPWTGLGLYGGFRGNRWLRNRIKIFKQFVIPSLQNQTSKEFILWCSWRYKERSNPYVQELIKYLDNIKEFKTVHTFSGVCFWDDKYSDEEARSRLLESLRSSTGNLIDTIGDSEYVYMTIQPSDDCYASGVVKGIQSVFKETDVQAMGFRQGYVINYPTMKVAEYNPTTIPPFFTIKFPREVFIDPLKHAEYTGPYKSHEYIADKLKFGSIYKREFMVGTHSENISTVFNHPFKGRELEGEERKEVLSRFGMGNTPPLKIKTSIRKAILRKLPHKIQRKLRYIFGERIWQRIYEFLRN
jgi:hypothetical protein